MRQHRNSLLAFLALVCAGILLFAVWPKAEEKSQEQAVSVAPPEPASQSGEASEEPVSLPSAGSEPEPLPEEAPAPRDPLKMPFVVQAPLAEWENPFFENACEEASLLMVAHWLRGETAVAPSAAREELLDLAAFQKKRFGHSVDTDAADTQALLEEYYGVQGSSVVAVASLEALKKIVIDGHVVIMPANGRKLGNPFFTPPGPVNHMLVVIGYDAAKDEFVTQDPGTKRGALYRYAGKTLFAALRDYPTGATHLPNARDEKRVIAIPLDAAVTLVEE